MRRRDAARAATIGRDISAASAVAIGLYHILIVVLPTAAEMPAGAARLRACLAVGRRSSCGPRARSWTRRPGMDAWIDTYHAVTRLRPRRTFVFLTDSAVGAREEHNLRHLVINLGTDVPRDHVVPFLTTKHSLEFCLSLRRARLAGRLPSLVVLGGDQIGRSAAMRGARVAAARGDPRARAGAVARRLGQSARRSGDAGCGYLADDRFTGEFFLTQVVSHHDDGERRRVPRGAASSGRSRLPGIFGVFYYRSANPKTLQTLKQFLPVPVEGLTREFAEGVDAGRRSARARSARSAPPACKHFYVSNLPVGRARQTLQRVLSSV